MKHPQTASFSNHRISAAAVIINAVISQTLTQNHRETSLGEDMSNINGTNIKLMDWLHKLCNQVFHILCYTAIHKTKCAPVSRCGKTKSNKSNRKIRRKHFEMVHFIEKLLQSIWFKAVDSKCRKIVSFGGNVNDNIIKQNVFCQTRLMESETEQ